MREHPPASDKNSFACWRGCCRTTDNYRTSYCWGNLCWRNVAYDCSICYAPGAAGTSCKAIAVTMAGNTLGISLGMPLTTLIGNEYGWRTEFISLGIIIGVMLF